MEHKSLKRKTLAKAKRHRATVLSSDKGDLPEILEVTNAFSIMISLVMASFFAFSLPRVLWDALTMVETIE